MWRTTVRNDSGLCTSTATVSRGFSRRRHIDLKRVTSSLWPA